MEASLPLEASLVGTADSVATRKYVLLARRDLDVRSLDGLQGLDLRVQIGGVGKVSRLWLDVLALREGYASGDDLLGTVTETLGASRTVLPVFFGQAQACVVGERSFATLTELNPQLAADLVVLAESPAFLWSVTCFRGDFDAELRASLEQAAIQMHRDPQGLQALMLFGIDRIRLLQPSDLDSVEELLREHASLTATTSAPPRGHDLPRTRAAALGEGR